MVRQTHTYTTLEISKKAYEDIKARLEEVGMLKEYQIYEDGVSILLHGVALVPEPEQPEQIYDCINDKPLR